MIMEDDNSLDAETKELETMPLSDVEDLEISDSEDASLNEEVLLSIDSNGRIVNGEVKYENDGDDCDMQYVQKKFLGYRLSDPGLRTSTEDLDVSDEENGTFSALTMQSVNLDGVASTSAEKNVSLSTLNYSHTILKEGNSIDMELISDDEASNSMNETFISKNKCKALPPGLTVKELSLEKSCVSPNQKVLNTFNVKNAFTSSLLLLDENVQDLQNEELVPMTCMEFLKSEYSDGNNTDAEDISLGSLDGIGETAVKERNGFQNGCDTFNNSLLGKDKIVSCPGDSRRSSTAEFNTEDEIFSLEKISNRCQRRVKKRNFIIVDKNEISDDGGTDEEVI